MKVLYFARARELAGTKTEEVDVPRDASVGEVLGLLSGRFGAEFAALVKRSTIMVDDHIIGRGELDAQPVGAELAILPPVSGGDGPISEHVASSAESLRTAVLTVSDRAAIGEYEDLTGPAIKELLSRSLTVDLVDSMVVEDSQERIREAIIGWCDTGAVDLVVTNGGTGLSPRDVTPEAVRSLLDVEAPGLCELMRSAGLAKTPLAALSRQVAGRRDHTIIVSVPGSVKGAVESIEAIIDVLPHACSVARTKSVEEIG